MKCPAYVAKSCAAIFIISAFQCGVLSGQQSYRTAQAFSRNSRNSPGNPPGKPVARPAPRFRGFNYARKTGGRCGVFLYCVGPWCTSHG